MVKVDVEVLAQVRDAIERLADYDRGVAPDRRVHAALTALRAAENRLANPLSQPSALGAAAAVEGLRKGAGVSPRLDEPPRGDAAAGAAAGSMKRHCAAHQIRSGLSSSCPSADNLSVR